MALLTFSSLGLMISFQNCSKVQATDIPNGVIAAEGTSSNNGNVSGNNPGLGSEQGGPISAIPGGGSENPISNPALPPEGGSVGSSSSSDSSDSQSCHKQYLLDQVVVGGMSKDLSVLKQHLQMQLIGCGKANLASIKVQGEGLCTAFHGTLLESQASESQSVQDIFSVKPASDNSSACKDGTFDKEIYDTTLNTLNNSSSVDFQANGDLVVKDGATTVVFVPKH